MIPDSRFSTRSKRAVTVLVAVCFFVLQSLLAGAAPGGMSYAGDVVCKQQSDFGSNGAPPAPGAHHHGACCLLHAAALLLPEARDALTVKVNLGDELPHQGTDYSADLRNAAPELGPLSARAPPHLLS